MAKSEGGLKSGGASVQFRWPLAVGLFLCLILLLWLWTPDASTYVSLTATQFDLLPVGREDLDAVPASVRGILLNPDLAETFVSSRSEAARRAEFEPRLPQSNGLGRSLPSPKLFVVAPSHTKVTIHVAQLESALSRIRATDLSIPVSWDGVSLEVNISAGVVADYGRIRLGQRLPLELRAPDGFPMDRFLEVLFRIGGMSAPDATALAGRSRERPREYLLVPRGYRIVPQQVQVASGTGTLLRYLSDDGPERRTLAWHTRDRVYFLSGTLTEVEALAIANSLD